MKEQSFPTLIGEDVPVTVYFDYQPKEPASLEYPGCDADVAINSIQLDSGHCIYDLLSGEWIQHVRAQCFISLEVTA